MVHHLRSETVNALAYQYYYVTTFPPTNIISILLFYCYYFIYFMLYICTSGPFFEWSIYVERASNTRGWFFSWILIYSWGKCPSCHVSKGRSQPVRFVLDNLYVKQFISLNTFFIYSVWSSKFKVGLPVGGMDVRNSSWTKKTNLIWIFRAIAEGCGYSNLLENSGGRSAIR